MFGPSAQRLSPKGLGWFGPSALPKPSVDAPREASLLLVFGLRPKAHKCEPSDSGSNGRIRSASRICFADLQDSLEGSDYFHLLEGQLTDRPIYFHLRSFASAAKTTGPSVNRPSRPHSQPTSAFDWPPLIRQPFGPAHLRLPIFGFGLPGGQRTGGPQGGVVLVVRTPGYSPEVLTDHSPLRTKEDFFFLEEVFSSA